jgi:hypothetical protein
MPPVKALDREATARIAASHEVKLLALATSLVVRAP